MPKSITQLTLFAASPGDVDLERDALGLVVEELNRTIAGQLGFVVELEGWETHVRPGMGTDPQAVINDQVTVPDAVVGIFWTRLGTPTPRAASGTVEEIELAMSRWRAKEDVELLVYFSRQPAAPQELDPAQLARLHDFKRELQAGGVLTRDYSTVAEFERLVREHLASWLKAYKKREPAAVNPANSGSQRPKSVAEQCRDGGIATEIDSRHRDQVLRLTEEIRAALVQEGMAPLVAETADVCLNELIANVRNHAEGHIARIEVDLHRQFSRGVSIDVYARGRTVDVDEVLKGNLTAMTRAGSHEHGLLVIARLTGNLHSATKYADEDLAGVGCYVHDRVPRYPQYLRGRADLASVFLEGGPDSIWIDDRFRYGPHTAMILKHAVERGSDDLLRAYFGGLAGDNRRLAIESAGGVPITSVFEILVERPHPRFTEVRSRIPFHAALEAAFPEAFQAHDVIMLSHDSHFLTGLQDWAALWNIHHYTNIDQVPGGTERSA